MWGFKGGETKPFPQAILDHHASFEGTIATPDKILDLLKNETWPELRELYSNIPHWVVRADLGRLLLVYFEGGVYCDADCFLKKPFCTEKNVWLFTEKVCSSTKELGPRECKDPDHVVRVANFFFGSKNSRHLFFKAAVDECLNRLDRFLVRECKTRWSHQDILWVCGPDVLTTVYHRHKHVMDDVRLYDSTYLKHDCTGSWRNCTE